MDKTTGLPSWRQVLLATVSTFALSVASSHSANAQSSVDIQVTPLIVPDVIQLNVAPPFTNTNTPLPFVLTNIANTDVFGVPVTTPLVVFDTLLAQAIAVADATIRGPNPGDPVFVGQSNTGTNAGNFTQSNLNSQAFAATATAFSGIVDVTNNVDFDVPGDGPLASSSATANAFINSVVNQTNQNTGASVTPPNSQTQNFTQTNTNTQNATATAVATTDDVSLVQNGAVTAGGNGLTAITNALATAAIVETATQSNSNSWTVTGITIGQTQIAAQTNTNTQNATANAVATSGDISVALKM